ncbi:HAMP domain-containing protein [bacterium]|nr:MAG: HAMP domain-containing protein [bacterium]
MSIRVKLLATFLAIAVIPLVFISALSFYNAKTALVDATLNGLKIAAQAKKAEVLEYLSGKKGRTLDFASDGFIRDQAEFITSANTNEEKIRASRILNTHLSVNKKPLDPEILEIRVLDLQGKIIGSSEGEYLLGLGWGTDQPYFLKGLKNTYIQDAGVFARPGTIEEFQEVIAISTPLKSRTADTAIGALVNFYNLANIQDVLLSRGAHQWGSPEEKEKNTSRDIFLVNEQKLLMTPSRKTQDYYPLKFKIETEPILKAIKSSLPINASWIDSMGNKVFGASELLSIEKDWKWIIVIEQDEHETLAPVRNLRNLSSTAGVVTMLLVLAMALVIARSVSRPIQQITQVADKISKGESKARIDISSKDEVGELATSFNRMVEKRLRVEEELRLAKTQIGAEMAKCEMVLASIGDGMIVVNQEGQIMMCNRESEAMFGWGVMEVLGKHFAEAIPCEGEKGEFIPDNERVMPQALSSGRTLHESAYYYRKDNTKFPAAVTASPILFEGKIIGAIGIFRDITKEKEVDKMKTDFISTVSHEIRTPLTTIREGVSQALDGILGGITDKQKEVFAIVLEDSDRLKRIIDNLLDISKIEAGRVELRKEFVDIVELINSVISAFSLAAAKKNLQLTARFSREKIMAYIDKDRIIQVFTNIVGNALKFTGAGYITVSAQENSETIECRVADTGGGIAKEDLPRLFSKFQQFGRQHGPGEKGTGLGLSISKGIIELHKGKIWAESSTGRGTAITFALPRYTTKGLFREYINNGLQRMNKERNALSILIFCLRNSKGDAAAEDEQDFSLTSELETRLRHTIRGETDTLVCSRNFILMLLPGVKKEGALTASERIHKVFDYYITKKGLPRRKDILCEVLSYPEDGRTDEELISRITCIKNAG